MEAFAVKCYSSPQHSWWFNPHPPPAPTARKHNYVDYVHNLAASTVTPRFLIPKMTRQREEKRPFVFLARILNGLSDEEWEGHGLDKHIQATPVPNLQLPGVLCPSYEYVSDPTEDDTVAPGLIGCGADGVGVPPGGEDSDGGYTCMETVLVGDQSHVASLRM